VAWIDDVRWGKLSFMSNENARAMFAAIEAGDLARVQSLVMTEPELIRAIVDNADPVGWAAFYAHPAIVSYLIAQGADVNWQTPRGTSPLAFAIKGADGAFKSHGVDRPAIHYQQCVELLRAAGATE
jgi:hypothetical protein